MLFNKTELSNWISGYEIRANKCFILETVRLLMSMKIDRVKDDKLSWSDMYVDQNNPQYQNLEDEVNYAVIMFSSSNQYFLLPEDKLSHLNFLYKTYADNLTILQTFKKNNEAKSELIRGLLSG